MGVEGQIWGPGPPKLIFLFFHVTKNPQNKFSLKFVSRQLYASTLIPEILKKIYRAVFEKMGFKILGGVALFRVRPLGGLPSPT